MAFFLSAAVPCAAQGSCKLSLTIVRGEGFTDPTGRTADPAVRVYTISGSGGLGEKICETKYIKNDNTPRWDHTCPQQELADAGTMFMLMDKEPCWIKQDLWEARVALPLAGAACSSGFKDIMVSGTVDLKVVVLPKLRDSTHGGRIFAKCV